jgi:hypothetical protein
VAAINGFDSVSHYLRAGLIVNTCTQYALTNSPDCSANFQDQGSDAGSVASASAAAAKTGAVKGYADTRRSPDLRRLDAYLHGLDPDEATATPPATAQPVAAQPAAAHPVTANEPAADPATGALLDYLMGG